MDYNKIENSFTEFILNLIGPTEDSDKQKEEKFNYIKDLIEKTLIEEKIDLTPHIFCFGSYPLKTYLQDSDLDITIIFEDKKKNSFVTNYSYEFLNKILFVIQLKLENINTTTETQIFSDINFIYADIRLLKFKYDNLSFDISINNIIGLCKIIFFKKLEDVFKKKLGNETIYKRTMVLIKAWCFYEGSIIGSNIGLIASYSLEVLIAYVFNKYSNKFQNEIEAFSYFFEVINDINWEKDIVSLFGPIPIDEFNEKLKLEIHYTKFFESLSKGDNSCEIVNAENIYEIVKNFERFKDFDKIQIFITLNKISTTKHMNIIDPMFINNNLGKSVNFYNFSKIKKVFELAKKELDNIKSLKEKLNCNAVIYFNLLVKMFSKSILNNYPELIYNTLEIPKIVINPEITLTHFGFRDKTVKNEYLKDCYNNNITVNSDSGLDENIMQNFNQLFLKKESNNTSNDINCINKFEENKINNCKKKFSYSNLLVNKNILQTIIDKETGKHKFYYNNDNSQNHKSQYDFPEFYNVSKLEEFLNNL